MKFIPRSFAPKITQLSRSYPVISITGPRQAGKTTFIKNHFKNYHYYNLENPQTKQLIRDDPAKFVNPHSPYVIFDEIQRVPELLSYIQAIADQVGKNGLYVISGSQNLSLSAKVNQSLAGRVAVVTLLPFTINELKQAQLLAKTDADQIIKGFYPRVYTNPLMSSDFYTDYLATYIERDVRQLKAIKNLSEFERFVQLLAGRVGQLFNASSLANNLSVSVKTVNNWLSILEASYLVFRLNPYYKNFGKRITKSFKVYFYDVGLVAYLLGVNTNQSLMNHWAYGALYENLVVADIIKSIKHLRLNIKPYFIRDKTGHEVDLLLEKADQLTVIEVKSSMTYKSDFGKNLRFWQEQSQLKNFQPAVVYNGQFEGRIKEIELINWKNLEKLISL